MTLPRLVVTGASGFMGRHFLDAIKEHYQIFGLARRSQARAGAPIHPNIVWSQVDIGEREPLHRVFQQIRDSGGADVVFHLAAHYDFTGEEHPEYRRTNVEGLRYVLDECRTLRPKRFVFASSVAACDYPRPGEPPLDESSPADGEHIYARTKRIGEDMLAEYREDFPSVIIRFGALFSDWCEYPPLFMFLSTWLSKAWNRRVLGGKGESAIPFLHVRDVVTFLIRVLDRAGEFEPGEVLIASTDGAISHRQLFENATEHYEGERARPFLMPRPLAFVGMYALDLLGRLIGERPFERPWMAAHIDRQLTVDASRTRERLGWEPRSRLEILRRLPFLVENLRTDPLEWNRRNQAAMREIRVTDNLLIYRLLEKHEQSISTEFFERFLGPDGLTQFPTYHRVAPSEIGWYFRVALRQLMNAVRTRDKTVFTSYCQDLAERRFAEGFPVHEVCGALSLLNETCLRALHEEPEATGLLDSIDRHLTMTVRFGCDQVEERFDQLVELQHRRRRT